MRFDVSTVAADRHFEIVGISYIGTPRSNTAVFITKKIEALLQALEPVAECLVFAEKTISVPQKLADKHVFCFSDKPQLEYARFADRFARERFEEEAKIRQTLMPGGYYVSDDAVIGDNAYIEPGCVIGCDVRIGRNAKILAGTVIRHATIGDNFLANEYAVVGANGFTIAEDENHNKFRIPTLGRVVIGDNVEIGAHDNISCGSGGDTVIGDNVKLDALVHLGHDVRLYENVEITAGGIIGGFDVLGRHAYVGINAVLRNRIHVGDNGVIGMGAVVTKSVGTNVTVAGNPARLFERK